MSKHASFSAEQRSLTSKIMVALDVSTVSAAEQLLETLSDSGCWMKVGMELYYSAGPQFVKELKQRGYKVFLDLKLHDIPNTIRRASAALTRQGVDMFNVHAAGGLSMMEHALIGVQEALVESAETSLNSAHKPIIIAVTQLTSTTKQVMNEQLGILGGVEEAVVLYSGLAHQAGLNGVVCSPQEVKRIKVEYGESFITVTPGIRPTGADVGDQKRVMTPAQAFAVGADFLVIGRPITAAPEPREALLEIVNSIQNNPGGI